jgi:hypothetical protein
VANCNVLAIALFIKKYKRPISDNMIDQLVSDWVKHWKDSLGNPTKKPCRVMKTYLDLMDISMDYLDENMCWDCWPDKDTEEVGAKTVSV